MELPDKIRQVLARRGVELRPDSSVFLNPVTGVETHCTPEMFAVFEAAVKSRYAGDAGFAGWCAILAAANGFTLPDPGDTAPAKAEKDYDECRRWLKKQGLYYDFMG